MKPRVTVELLCSPADTQTLINALTSDRAGSAIFTVDFAESAATVRVGAGVVAHVRFETAAAAAAWHDAIVARWSAGGLRNRIFVGSRVGRHDCTHDQAAEMQSPCVMTWTTKV